MERLYIKRKEGGRGLMSAECCVREEKNSLGFYVVNSGENLLRRVVAAETINTEDTVVSGEFKKQNAQELQQILSLKKIHEQFVREMMRLGNDYPKVI